MKGYSVEDKNFFGNAIEELTKGCEIVDVDSVETRAKAYKMYVERSRERKYQTKIRAEHIEYAMHCGVGKRHASCTLENFNGNDQIKAQIRNWASGTENLLIQNPMSGNGKTHLGVAAMKLFAVRGGFGKKPSVTYTVFTELMEDIRSTFNDDSVKTIDIVNLFKDSDILVIDDIGAEKVTDHVLSTLYSILNRRYEDMKPTIITTNLNESDIVAAYGSRMLSRLISGVVVSVEGNDDRIAKKNNREIPEGATKRRTIYEMMKKNQKKSTFCDSVKDMKVPEMASRFDELNSEWKEYLMLEISRGKGETNE